MRILALVLLGLTSSPCFFDLSAQEAGAETKRRFTASLRKLASDDYEVREAASAEIAALPADALGLIEKEIKKPDLDVDIRSRLESAAGRLRAKAAREVSERKKAASLAWTRKTVVGAYDKNGKKDPRWDAKAREALEAISLVWADLSVSDRNLAQRACALSTEAVQAGCGDPLVLYAHARMYDVIIRKDIQEAVRLHLEAAQAMKDRGAHCHPLRQSYVFGRCALFLASKKPISDDDRKEVQKWLDLALARYGEAAKDPEVPDQALVDCGDGFATSWNLLTQDRKTGCDKAVAALSKGRPGSILPLILKGTSYIHYAWDARGSSTADTVKEEGWKLMADRLVVADAALNEAWLKNPSDAQAPTLMISVELGRDNGRPAMEKWFERAMKADPNNFEACRKKMYYLEPKWHGSREDMLAFGRELLKGANWEARLPFQLVDAHHALAAYENDKMAYYRGEDVWADIKAVYEGCLKHRPDLASDRTWYAKLACWCGRYREAHQQFLLLGEKIVPSVFADQAEMDRLKAEALEKGR
jgi:hypothetical protein